MKTTSLNIAIFHWVHEGVTRPRWYDHNKQTHINSCWQVRLTAARHPPLQHHVKGLQRAVLCGSMYLCAGSISQVGGAIHHRQLSLGSPAKVRSVQAGGSADALRVPSLNLSAHTQTHTDTEATCTLPACVSTQLSVFYTHARTDHSLAHHHTPGLAAGLPVLSGPVDF